ncbi:hypothetical protein ES703_90032 [subsurface metagenome]
MAKRMSYQQLDPLVTEAVKKEYPEMEVEVMPTMGIKAPERTYGEYYPDKRWLIVMLRGSTGYLDEALAVAAHELGHHEQQLDIEAKKIIPPPTEPDAYLRGIKFAQKWGILPAYARDLINRVNYYPQQFPKEVERVIAHIKSLLS